TEEDVTRQVQMRQSLAMLLEQARVEAVKEPVRQQFEDDLHALTEAEQDSKELKSAKRHLLFDRIIETVELPFPVGPATVEAERRYMHHYNFPPYSVGETGFMRGPKRRDIGHGALAQRALEPMVPELEEFPYTIRLVSETLESNGSSSMGSVCGSTLALMDAGVPITAPVSGIAMGLVKEGDDYVILNDIPGAEEHLGVMDFKVAGAHDGITALQMDIK